MTPIEQPGEKQLSDERLAEMLAGLEGVTPGPWYEGDKWVFVAPRSGRSSDALENVLRNEEAQANAAHIARCDPDTIRSLITALQALRASTPVSGEGEWVLVPTKPTREMCAAAMDVLLYSGNVYSQGDETVIVETYTAKAVYAVMLAAAPAHPIEKEGVRDSNA